MRNSELKKSLSIVLSAAFLWGVPAMGDMELPVGVRAVVQAAEAQSWSFNQDLAGWKYGGTWAYDGQPVMEHDAAFGGSLRIEADFTAHVKDSWSEIKIEDGAAGAAPVELKGQNVLSFDLYYNPAAMKTGSLKTKLYAKSTTGEEVINVNPDIDLKKARDAGNGMRVVTVKVPFSAVSAKVNYLCLSIVGCNTDYKGKFYVNQLAFKGEVTADGYTDKTAAPVRKQKQELASLPVPAQVSLTDAQATAKTAQLYAYLKASAASGQVLYGHQNEMHKKVGHLAGASDTYDMVQDYAAIVGVDGLALTGNELSLTDAEKAAGLTLTDKLAQISIAASRNGSILTMSCHMPNFAEVAKKPKVDGKYDYSGYSPNVTSGDVVKRILPGGDLNEVYNGYLDMVAEYGAKLQEADVPVLFRPFHENNGSWFWWGAAYCTPSQYKNLFHYTEEYLRDQKGLHNFLYVYSPGGPFQGTEDYLTRYPGDAYIDVVGFDMYHRDPAQGDDWMNSFGDTMNVVQSFAAQHNKLAAVTEAGVLVGNSAMAKAGNQRKDWFREALKAITPHRMAYFMTWSNFDETNFDEPYMVTDKRGHEMINDFIRFYNEPQAIFASQVPDYTSLQVQAQAAAASYGYLTAPGSMARICQPMTITAKAAGNAAKVRFVLKKKDGTLAAALDAQQKAAGEYSAELSQEKLAALGTTVGSIELQLDGQKADSVQVLFNMPEPPADPAMVDDFENYYGDNGLLQGSYSTNCGAGCSVVPSLAAQHSQGSAGLAFSYKINKGGYAGIVKSLKGADWSGCSGIEFWITPDGKGQKLIAQLNSNGEDFEVDLTDIAKQTKPQLVKLPFSLFKGKNHGTFDKAHVQHFAIYCNTIGEAAVNSVMYFDDIHAVK